ncbi:MAG: hypothetical protein ACRCX8_05245 [Sarcina sp.]
MPIKSISFKDSYQEQYDFLMSQDNPSQFICELIKSHMEDDNSFDKRVEDIVARYFENNFKLFYQFSQSIPPSENIPQQDIIEEDIEDIEDPWG